MRRITIVIILMFFLANVVCAETAEEWLEKGQVAYEAENYDEAIQCIKKAIALDPNHAKAHYKLGIMYDTKGLFDEAIFEYKQTLKIDPHFVAARENLITSDEMLGEVLDEYEKTVANRSDLPPKDLYLDLMKLSLTDMINVNDQTTRAKLINGQGKSERGVTMIGLKRLDNLQFVVEDVIDKRIPGDLIETGAWRGGACIFMRAILKVHGVKDRKVWVADSFEGLPTPNPEKYPADGELNLPKRKLMVVPIEAAKNNFKRYGLLDDQVIFLKGLFKDTLPTAPIEKLAVLRLDGDLYESTMDSLVNLYPKLSPGGYIIVDDTCVPSCVKAVQDYRKKHHITEPITRIDWCGVYWQKK